MKTGRWAGIAAALLLLVPGLPAIPGLSSLTGLPAWSGVREARAAEPARFSLDYRNAHVEDVLRALTAQAGLGLAAGDKITGTVTLHLRDVTFDEALQDIAGATGIAYTRGGNVLTVNPQGVTTHPFVLHYVNAGAARAAVAHLLSPLGTAEVFNGQIKEDLGKTVALNCSNILLVRDNQARLDEVSGVLEVLDRAPRQISIEAKLVEVSLSDEDRMGMDWQLAAHISGAAEPTTFPFNKNASGGTFTPTPNTNPQFAGGTADFPAGQVFPFSRRDDFTFGRLSAAEFRVAMEFLSTKARTNLVSNPKIATLENKPAEILVGTVVPIALYQNSQLTGALQLAGYEEKKIGVKLSVNPRVTGDGTMILMTVHPEVSEIVEYRGQFNERPVTTTREANTEVMVKDGETLVIGGLVRESQIKQISKVPFLGDIPGLGELFKHRHNLKEKVELMVFVTPHLMPN